MPDNPLKRHSAILIRAASLGYAQTPAFQYLAPGQESMEQRIAYEITVLGGALRRAVELEGLQADWGLPSGGEPAGAKAKL
jgi:coenzyme A diphosphatase NUDT7